VSLLLCVYASAKVCVLDGCTFIDVHLQLSYSPSSATFVWKRGGEGFLHMGEFATGYSPRTREGACEQASERVREYEGESERVTE